MSEWWEFEVHMITWELHHGRSYYYSFVENSYTTWTCALTCVSSWSSKRVLKGAAPLNFTLSREALSDIAATLRPSVSQTSSSKKQVEVNKMFRFVLLWFYYACGSRSESSEGMICPETSSSPDEFDVLQFCSASTQFPAWVWFCLCTVLVCLLLLLCAIFKLLLHKKNTVCGLRGGESSDGVVVSEMSSLTDEYNVFLSFRGPDTRQGFTDVLYDTMKRAGIRVFRDDDEVSVGQPLQKILHAIKTSQICVPIFSLTFAESSWCLREVAMMIELKKVVMPIFFDVKPDDLKLKSRTYRNNLKVHEKKNGKEQVKVWEDALKSVAKIKGKEVMKTRYTEFCKEFVDEVLRKLKPRKRSNSEFLVGLNSQIESVMELWDTESNDVRYIGIHGMGGIGKSTLAKSIFKEQSANFDSSCFLENVRESLLRSNGLQDLQKKLQMKLDPEFARGCNSYMDFEERFQGRKVLIVLDDVDKSGQIKSLAGQSSWFGDGSRIIVTTRNVDVLTKYADLDQSEVRLFEMRTLYRDQAFELFHWYAFRGEKPPSIVLEAISREIVPTARGLPLALKVIGSRLYNIKDEAVWRDFARRLKSKPLGEVTDTLKISYEALEDDQKQIFLDIACIPAMMDKDKSIAMWESSELYPRYNLAVLNSMSLVKFEDNRIWMHDLLRDLGKDIALKDGTRIWKNEKILEVLRNKEGKEKVEALYIDKPLEVCLTHEHFASFLKLRFLHLVGSNIEGDFRNLLPNLTWFSWRHCPPVLNVTNFYLKNLVVLDLSFSFISESWGGWSLIEILNNLKVLDLSNCQNLTRTPDFSKTNRLERLDLHNCSKLREIHGSIGKLQMLKYLNLRNCYSLEGLPNEIGCLVNLEKLKVSKLTRRRKFMGNHGKVLPSTIGHLESLLVLELRYLEIVDIPYSIGGLSKLEVLSLYGCSMIKDLPDSLGNMVSLKKLNLSRCEGITELPDSIGGLVKLEILDLAHCRKLKMLPESLGLLQELKVLKLWGCGLRKLPVSIGLLKKLEVIEYREYSGKSVLEELPMEIGSLSSLRELILPGSSISTLPSTIIQLTLLEELDLDRNHHLQELPDLPLSLRKWPPQLSTNFKFEGIEKLTKLRRLTLGLANATTILQSGRGSLLYNRLTIDFQPDLALCSLLPSAATSSRELVGNSKVMQGLKLPNLSSLSNLSNLELKNWYIKDGFESTVGIQYLGNLNIFSISNCGIEIIQPICLLKNLMAFDIRYCGSIKMLPDLSEMKNLEFLIVFSCKELVEIPGLESLKSFELSSCPKLRTIKGTQKLMLTSLIINQCESLQNVDELKKRSKRGTIEVTPYPFQSLEGLRSLHTPGVRTRN